MLPDAHVVDPVYPVPPHWPHFATVLPDPPVDVVVLLVAAGAEVVAEVVADAVAEAVVVPPPLADAVPSPTVMSEDPLL